MTSPTIRVTGPEAASFLNNLLTQELVRDPERRLRYGALLTPQGKVIADLMIWRIGDGYLLDPQAGAADDLAARLGRFKLRAQVQIAVLETPPALPPEPDPRLAALGPRTPGVTLDATAQIRAGVPDLSADAAPEEVFALEALLEELHGVDFQKGCFPGQENVSRMKRRATTRRKFCRIAFDGPAPPFATPIIAGGIDLGTVRSGIDGAAIALLRLDRALEAIDKGETLMAGAAPVRLDPPAWLILPTRGGDD
jgi:tRNA-modifying protein YgfZ